MPSSCMKKRAEFPRCYPTFISDGTSGFESAHDRIISGGVKKTAAQRNTNTATAPVHSQKPRCQNTEWRSALRIGTAQESFSRVRTNNDSLKKIPTSGNSVTADQTQNNRSANTLRPFHEHQQPHNIPIARNPAAERPRISCRRLTPKTSCMC